MSSGLSSLLVQDQVVSVKTLEQAFRRQVIYGGLLDTNLLESGAVDEDVLLGYLARAAGVSRPPEWVFGRVDHEALRLIEPAVAAERMILPVQIDGRSLRVIASADFEQSFLDRLGVTLDVIVAPWVVPEIRILEALDRCYGIPLSPRFAALATKLGPRRRAQLETAELVQTGSQPAELAEPAAVVETAAVVVDAGAEPERSESGHLRLSEETLRMLSQLDGDAREPAAAQVSPVQAAAEAVSPEPAVATPEPQASDEPAVAEPARPATEPTSPPPPPRRPRTGGSQVDPSEPRVTWGLEELTEQLGRANNRDEILDAALRYSGRFFQCAVLFIVHDKQAAGFGGIGPVALPETLQHLTADLVQPSFMEKAFRKRRPYVGAVPKDTESFRLLAALGRSLPRSVAVIPVTIRSRVVVMVYGDNDFRQIRQEDLKDLLPMCEEVSWAFERLLMSRKRAKYADQPGAGETVGRLGDAAREQMQEDSGAQSSAGSWGAADTAQAEVSSPEPEPKLESEPMFEPESVPEPEARFEEEPEPPSAPTGPGEEMSLDGTVDEYLEDTATASGRHPSLEPMDVRALGDAVESSLQVDEQEPFYASSPDDLWGPLEPDAAVTQPEVPELPNRPSVTAEMLAPVASSGAGDAAPEPPDSARVTAEMKIPPPEEEAAPDAGGAPVPAPHADADADARSVGHWTDVPASHEPAGFRTGPRVRDGASVAAAREARAREQAPADVVDVPFADVDEDSWVPSATADSIARAVMAHAESPGREPSRPVAATPPPPQTLKERSVATENDGDDLFSLIDQLDGPNAAERDREELDGVIDRLVDIGEPALRWLIERFPGQRSVDRFAFEVEDLPHVEEHGPLLRTIVRFGEQAVPYLLPLLTRNNVELRFYATFMFTALPYPESLKGLLPRLFDTDYRIRRAAVRAMRGLRGSADFGRVHEQLLRDLHGSHVSRQRNAADAAAAFEFAAAVPALIDVLETGEPPAASAAREALYQLTRKDFGDSPRKWRAWWEKNKDTDRRAWLVEGLADKSRSVRDAAIRDLERVTGRTLGFDAGESRRHREGALKRWRQYLVDHPGGDS